MTKRTEAEDKLKKAHDGLEKEVEERTKELAKANNRLIGEIEDRKQAEETLQRKTYDLDERVKELNCLYGISSLIEKPGISIEEIFQGLVDLVPPSWQYPEITSARILLEDKEYKTESFKETNWKQSSEIVVHGKRAGVLEICYLEERPEIDEGPFLKEERNLIKAITGRLGHIIERMRAEDALRKIEHENKLILGNMSDYVWVLDLSTLKTAYTSPVVEKILGYSPDEMKALDLDAFFSPETMETVTGVIEKEISIDGQDGADSDRRIVMELEILRKDGSEMWTEISSSFLRDNEGKPTSLICIARDSTERKLAERQKELKTKVLDTINRSVMWKKSIEDILNAIKEFSGFEAVAIRMREGEDYPYYVTQGFPAHFVEAERYLCTP